MADWRLRALCGIQILEGGPDWWYPPIGSVYPAGYAGKAKAVCNGCPVRQECLDFSFEVRQWRFGIWGGLLPKERVDLAKALGVYYRDSRGRRPEGAMEEDEEGECDD